MLVALSNSCETTAMKILGIDTNAKTVKGQKLNYVTGIVYLAPSDESGEFNTCGDASQGCRESCLFFAGRGEMKSVKEARIAKTLAFYHGKEKWMGQAVKEITALVKKAAKLLMTPCVRPNGTSDIPWERVKLNGKNLMEQFPNVQFYDYTKSLSRMLSFLRGEMPANYHLTFSRSEDNEEKCLTVLNSGGNVAVVFRKGFEPTEFYGKEVINGDEHDLRFLDKKNVIVRLVEKGRAKKNKKGFVVEAF